MRKPPARRGSPGFSVTRWLLLPSLLLLSLWCLGVLQLLIRHGPAASPLQKEYIARKLALLGEAPGGTFDADWAPEEDDTGSNHSAQQTPRSFKFPFTDDEKYRIYDLGLPDRSHRCKHAGICDGDHTKGNDGLQNITSAADRRERVRQATRWTWAGYKKHAWGLDELYPGSHSGRDWFKVGLTIVDGIDTLMIQGLAEETREARHWIANHFSLQGRDISVFECTIRLLGGLLSAYYHSEGDLLFLNKALEFAERVQPVFNTYSGLAKAHAMLGQRMSEQEVEAASSSTTKAVFSSAATNLAEAGTLSLEWSMLSHVTSNEEWRAASMMFWHRLREMSNMDGLHCIDMDGDRLICSGNRYSLGSASDSAYEYMLKQWILSGGVDEMCVELYRDAMYGMRKYLIITVRTFEDPAGFPVLIEATASGSPPRVNWRQPRLEHLTCFVPGMLALGHMYGVQRKLNSSSSSRSSSSNSSSSRSQSGPYDADDDLMLAVKLMKGCYRLYTDSASGLAYDSVMYNALYPPPPPRPPFPPQPPSPPPPPPVPPMFPPLPPGGHPYTRYQGQYRDSRTMAHLVDPRTGQIVPFPPPPAQPISPPPPTSQPPPSTPPPASQANSQAAAGSAQTTQAAQQQQQQQAGGRQLKSSEPQQQQQQEEEELQQDRSTGHQAAEGTDQQAWAGLLLGSRSQPDDEVEGVQPSGSGRDEANTVMAAAARQAGTQDTGAYSESAGGASTARRRWAAAERSWQKLVSQAHERLQGVVSKVRAGWVGSQVAVAQLLLRARVSRDAAAALGTVLSTEQVSVTRQQQAGQVASRNRQGPAQQEQQGAGQHSSTTGSSSSGGGGGGGGAARRSLYTDEYDRDDLLYVPTALTFTNYLRPEVIESLFYLWRATGDPVYQEWGWSMFRSFEAFAKVPTGGYVVVDNVMVVPPRTTGQAKMESFWLAETLKYFYLLFSEPDVIPLDQYVLNTEAHPLPIWGSQHDVRVRAKMPPELKHQLDHVLHQYAVARRA